MKIIYCSNTGFTKQYAIMLANKLGIESIDVKDIKKYDIKDEEIIFLGWIFAGIIMGLNKVRQYKLKCVISVGIIRLTDEYKNELIKSNNIERDKSFFYIQGGIDYKNLKGIKKILLKAVASNIIKENKNENEGIINILKNGGSLVKEENLNDIIEYINKNNA